MTEETSLIKYPCSFPIKVMGKSHERFISTVCAIVQDHAPDFNETTIEIKQSTKGGYLSVTCTIMATSRVQMDTLYQELFDHPMVAMVL